MLIVLARLLQPHDFGIVALATGIMILMALILEKGFPQAIIQRKEIEDIHISTAFWATMGLGLLFMMIGILLSAWLATLLKEPLFATVFNVVSIGIAFEALSGIPRALLHREMQFRPLARHALIAAVISGILGLTMAWKGMGAWSIVAQVLTDRGIRMFLLYTVVPWRPMWLFSSKEFRTLYSYALHSTGFIAMEYIGIRAAEVIIAITMGLTALGYYALASKFILTLSQFVFIAFSRIGVPLFAHMQGDSARIRRTLLEILRLGSLCAIPLFVGLCLLSPEVILFFFGQKWHASIPVLQVLSVMGMLISLFSWNNTILLAIGKPKSLFRISLISTICTIIAMIATAPFGLAAVAAVQILRVGITAFMTFLILKEKIGIVVGEYLSPLLSPLMASAIMATALLAMRYILPEEIGLMGFAASVVLGILVYGISVFVLAPHLRKDVVQFYRNIQKDDIDQ